MNPLEALEKAIWITVTHDKYSGMRSMAKPGVLLQMPVAIQEAVKNLRSSDLEKMRPDACLFFGP